MSTLVTTNLKHGGAASPNIVLNSDGTFNIGDSKVVTPTGSAPSYTCRAWVNFNGTGTVAVRASGNVTDITDGGTGTYTVNITTAMPDADYAVASSCSGAANTNVNAVETGTQTTSSVVVFTNNQSGALDLATVCVSIFR